MERQTNFSVEVVNGEIRFSVDGVVIILNEFSFNNDKHYITHPYTAHAQFSCSGKQYSVSNSKGIATVEDWYAEELLPKYQMFSLLMTTEDE